jgi:site-specific DNA-cytosine methylase
MLSGVCYRPLNVGPAIAEKDGFLWPTPTLSGNHNRAGSGPKSGDGLATAVRLWPTPRASEYKGTGPIGSKSHDHRLKRGYLDSTVQAEEGRTGWLSPEWVELLMGFPLGYTLTEGPPIKSEYGWDPEAGRPRPWPDTGGPAVAAIVDPKTWQDGTWEEGIPRLTTEKTNRRKRIKALGNAVVPQCAKLIGQLLADRLSST